MMYDCMHTRYVCLPKGADINNLLYMYLILPYIFLIRAISEFAKHLGKPSDMELFLSRSKNYRNLWDSRRNLMCARNTGGDFECPVDPELNDWILHSTDFTEGTDNVGNISFLDQL